MARPPSTYGKGRLRPLVSRALAAHMQQSRAGASDEEVGPSYANSTFTAASATGTADGSTAVELTLTLRDTENALMADTGVTFVIGDGLVDADESSFTSDVSTIEETAGLANLTFVARNAAGVALPNIQTARIVFAYTGTGDTITPVSSATNTNGTYTATFESTAVEAGETIAVTVDGVLITDTVTMTVTGDAPATVAPVFLSRYLTGLGTSLAAVRDTDEALPWSSVSHNNDVGQLEVVTVAWPDGITEALETIPPSSHSGWAEPDATGIPIADVGESMYYRWYYEVLVPDGLVDSDFHPIQCGPSAGSIEWAFYLETDAGTDQFRPAFYVNASTNSWPNYQFFGPLLDKSTVYRFELRLARLTSTTFNLHPRIYNAAGAQTHGPSDFNNSTSSGTLADLPTLNHSDATRLALLQAGCNGVDAADTSAMGVPFSRMAKDAISHEDWSGAHGHVTGE